MNRPTALHQTTEESASPYHPGEQTVQARHGVRDRAEKLGRNMLSPELTEAQREFFTQIPFVVTAHIDHEGQAWAGLMTGAPGFIQPSPKGESRVTLLAPHAPTGFDASPGDAVGLLGIDFSRRRRNRINGILESVASDHIDLDIDQGYGNCPKYINERPWDTELFSGEYALERETHLSAFAAEMIRSADTFFIASSSGPRSDDNDVQASAWGVDVSHRGGSPGFLRQEGEVLWFDDFPGNNMFNTLGNLQQYPPCGLLIVDFVNGNLLQLAGRAELHHDGEQYSVGITVQEVRHWRRIHT